MGLKSNLKVILRAADMLRCFDLTCHRSCPTMVTKWTGTYGTQVGPFPYICVSYYNNITHRISGIDAGIKIRPNSQDLEELSPEMQMRWRDFYANSPDRPLLLMGPMAAYVKCYLCLPFVIVNCCDFRFIGGPPPSFEDNFFSLGWFQVGNSCGQVQSLTFLFIS